LISEFTEELVPLQINHAAGRAVSFSSLLKFWAMAASVNSSWHHVVSGDADD
jgi:hypothetical protein